LQYGVDFLQADRTTVSLSLDNPVRNIFSSQSDDIHERKVGWASCISSDMINELVEGQHELMMEGECLEEIVGVIKSDLNRLDK